jgi:hypothetical protein
MQQTAGRLGLRHHNHPLSGAAERSPDALEQPSKPAKTDIEQLDAGTVKAPWAIDEL